MAIKRSGTTVKDLANKNSIASKTVKAVDRRDITAVNVELGFQGNSAKAETSRTAERAIRQFNRVRFDDQSRVNPEYKWR